MCRLKWKMKIASEGLWKCRRLKTASLKCYQSYEHDRTHWSLSGQVPLWYGSCLGQFTFIVRDTAVNIAEITQILYIFHARQFRKFPDSWTLSCQLVLIASRTPRCSHSVLAVIKLRRHLDGWAGVQTVLVGNLFDLEWNLSSRLRLLGFRKKLTWSRQLWAWSNGNGARINCVGYLNPRVNSP